MTDTPMVCPIGTRRRIRALARLGWSRTELAHRLGLPVEYVESVFTFDRIEQPLAAAVVALYDRLSMTLSPEPGAAHTAAFARRMTWPAPLAWDDDAIDDPEALSCGRVPGRHGVDESAIVRVLTGDWKLARRLTKPEKTEVCRRWHRQGRSLAQLEALTGWKPERYFRVPADLEGEVA